MMSVFLFGMFDGPADTDLARQRAASFGTLDQSRRGADLEASALWANGLLECLALSKLSNNQI